MSFEVETGTGSPTANSYATVAQFREYWISRGEDFVATLDATIQPWLVEGTDYVDDNYDFDGSRTFTVQALEWPRTGATDKNCDSIDSDFVPTEVISAAIFMARRAKDETLTRTDYGIKSQRIGPISKTYEGTSGSVSYPKADKILKHLLRTGIQMERVN